MKSNAESPPKWYVELLYNAGSVYWLQAGRTTAPFEQKATYKPPAVYPLEGFFSPPSYQISFSRLHRRQTPPETKRTSL